MRIEYLHRRAFGESLMGSVRKLIEIALYAYFIEAESFTIERLPTFQRGLLIRLIFLLLANRQMICCYLPKLTLSVTQVVHFYLLCKLCVHRQIIVLLGGHSVRIVPSRRVFNTRSISFPCNNNIFHTCCAILMGMFVLSQAQAPKATFNFPTYRRLCGYAARCSGHSNYGL